MVKRGGRYLLGYRPFYVCQILTNSAMRSFIIFCILFFFPSIIFADELIGPFVPSPSPSSFSLSAPVGIESFTPAQGVDYVTSVYWMEYNNTSSVPGRNWIYDANNFRYYFTNITIPAGAHYVKIISGHYIDLWRWDVATSSWSMSDWPCTGGNQMVDAPFFPIYAAMNKYDPDQGTPDTIWPNGPPGYEVGTPTITAEQIAALTAICDEGVKALAGAFLSVLVAFSARSFRGRYA